jgi:hypothetical protein
MEENKHPETDELTDRLHKQEAPLVVRYQEMTMKAQKLEIERDAIGSVFALKVTGVLWQSVADQMPDDDLTVMIHHPEEDEPVWLGYHDGDDDTWRTVDGTRCEVTHWAEMPDAPNAEGHAQLKLLEKGEG